MTDSEIKRRLDYNPESGIFTYKVKIGKNNKGDIAGHTNKKGYLRVCVNGKQYRLHRLAWYFCYGYMPRAPFEVDHIDQNKKNNAIENLRVITRREQERNKPLQKNSKTGYPGITFRDNKFIARIQSRPQITIGRFETLLDAVAARKTEEIRRGYTAKHGQKPINIVKFVAWITPKQKEVFTKMLEQWNT